MENKQTSIKMTKLQNYIKQDAHGPQLAHLSEIATGDMYLLCNIFSILS